MLTPEHVIAMSGEERARLFNDLALAHFCHFQQADRNKIVQRRADGCPADAESLEVVVSCREASVLKPRMLHVLDFKSIQHTTRSEAEGSPCVAFQQVAPMRNERAFDLARLAGFLAAGAHVAGAAAVIRLSRPLKNPSLDVG